MVNLPHTSKNLRSSIAYSKTQCSIKLAKCVLRIYMYDEMDTLTVAQISLDMLKKVLKEQHSLSPELWLYYLQLFCFLIVLLCIFKEILWPGTSLQRIRSFSAKRWSIELFFFPHFFHHPEVGKVTMTFLRVN